MKDDEIAEDFYFSPSIQLVAGGVYEARNPNKNFTFKVKSVSGSYIDKSQVVVLTIDGFDGDITLSDAGASYLVWDGSQFVASNTMNARENVQNVVMCLACYNSNLDYTITSATLNDTMNSLGATGTTFSKVK